jgi:ABC-type lipoprotein release transport system permease subunit
MKNCINKIGEIFKGLFVFLMIAGFTGIILYVGLSIMIGIIPVMVILIAITGTIIYFNKDKIKEVSEYIKVMDEANSDKSDEVKSDAEISSESEVK